MTPRFVAFTPNLALDRTLDLPEPLSPARLNRAGSPRETAGGKGVNAARVLRALGAEVTVAGFVGGYNGGKLRALLSREGLPGIFGEVEGETRENLILMDGRAHPTEINEPGPAVGPEDWRGLVARFPPGQVLVAGSLPPGIAPGVFGELLAELSAKPVVDTAGPALRAALEAGAALVAPNLRELASVVPMSGSGLSEARALFGRYGVPVLLSMGAKGAALLGEESWLAHAPKVSAVNPVASGDCLLAAFLWARAEGWTAAEALRLGVAAGTENAAAGGGARVSRKEIFGRLGQVTVEAL